MKDASFSISKLMGSGATGARGGQEDARPRQVGGRTKEVVTVPELEEAQCARDRGEEAEVRRMSSEAERHAVRSLRKRERPPSLEGAGQGSRKIWLRIYTAGEIFIVLKNINNCST
jgi:hypothetical protein